MNMGKFNWFSRAKNFLKDIRGELKKVTWPTKNDLYKTTLAVIVSSIVFGLYLFGVDFVFSRIVKKIIAIFQ